MSLWGWKNGPEIGEGKFKVKLNIGVVIMGLGVLGFIVIMVATC